MNNEIQKKETSVDPWTEIDRVFDAMRSRFADSFGFVPFGAFASEVGLRAPRTDIADTGTAYKVVAEIPGIPKEKLDIRIRGPMVEIRGESATDSEQKDEHYVHRERSYAGYYRAFELPEAVVAAEAKAKVVNGLLELELPKQTPTPSEQEVKVSVE
jgi:HSP20 family protein